jgi:hypothetical protein
MERVEVQQTREQSKPTEDRSNWNWDGEFQEPTISIDRFGERAPASKTVWKKSTSSGKVI